MDTQNYITESLRQLSQEEHYKRTPRDLTNQITNQIQAFIRFLRIRKLLPEHHLAYLTPKNCRTPIFYMLPKIHKANNPGRPIVSGCYGPTEKLSAYLDYYLQPLAQKVNSYIKDTNHFLQKLMLLDNIPTSSILVTIDVTALYTNIPHRDGILAVKEALETRRDKEPKTWILLRLLYFVLTKTCFKFDNQFYEQISGTTMGTKCAPSYAILFMDKFERDFLAKCALSPLMWWRYIDDIFMIWPHSSEELYSFISGLNEAHSTLKLTYEASLTTVHFLDVRISKDENGIIQTSVYTKPTDAHLYLHYTSFHPKHQQKSIPYSQAIRMKRICSAPDLFQEACKNLKMNLRNRGYPTALIESAIRKAASKDRIDLLHSTNTPTTEPNPAIPFIVTYNPRTPPIKRILENNRKILTYSQDLQSIASRQFLLVQRRCLNLKQLLVHTDLNPTPASKGSSPCNNTGPRSAVGNVSGYRCVSDCRSRGHKFDPGPVPYFRGD